MLTIGDVDADGNLDVVYDNEITKYDGNLISASLKGNNSLTLYNTLVRPYTSMALGQTGRSEYLPTLYIGIPKTKEIRSGQFYYPDRPNNTPLLPNSLYYGLKLEHIQRDIDLDLLVFIQGQIFTYNVTSNYDGSVQ